MSKEIQLKNGNEKVYPHPFFPVGAIYMSVTPANPSVYFGGVWVAWGSGRVPVCINTSDSNFNTVEKIGGHKEMQAHTHLIGKMDTAGVMLAGSDSAHLKFDSNIGIPSSIAGGGNSGNLQPYITCYMWKRTA